jgi:carboxymethylenebutenolidase
MVGQFTPVTYSESPFVLKGFIHRPEGDGPFPAIVYNHGSEPKPGPKPRIASFFTSKGFVFFVPHRRGQGQSSGPNITGLISSAGGAGEKAEMQVSQLDAQAADVEAAVSYLASLPFVDKGRMAVMGCSYGGIMTVLTAERGLGLKCAVDFAGASMSWGGNRLLQERLKKAVRESKVPILFIQAENDFNTQPTRILSDEMSKHGSQPCRSKIYPAVGKTHMEGHAGFCAGSGLWGDDVLAFIGEYLRAPERL